jgi:hypothetical protein
VDSLHLLVASVLAAMQFLVPRKYLFLPMLVAATHVPLVAINDGSVTVLRLVLLALLARAFAAPKPEPTRVSALDGWLVLWALVLLATGFGHGALDGNPVVTRLGVIYEVGGVYLACRMLLRTSEDIIQVVRCLAVCMLPLGILMVIERLGGGNAYEALGATFEMVRDGKIRAAGSFGNAILAGTVGGVMLPLMMMLSRHRWQLAIGALGCFAVVFSSTSTGPYMTTAFSLALLGLWRWRVHLSKFWWSLVACLLVLHLVMKDPVWYLMARIDITGGSVAFHRAELITQALAHLGEWWLIGTDHTRHWMPYGVPWSNNHADITNYFLKMGVLGGLPLLFAFLGIVVSAFAILSADLRHFRARGASAAEWRVWCLLVAFSALCFSFIGVAPYDQSTLYYFMLLAMVPLMRSAWAGLVLEQQPESSDPEMSQAGVPAPSREARAGKPTPSEAVPGSRH